MYPIKTILIVGASGLTGRALLDLALEDPVIERVIVWVRQPLGIQHPKLSELTIDFNELEHYRSQLHADAVLCCLGTTIKQAGSEARFKTVDYFYPLQLAMMAKMNGIHRFAVISSLGANAQSPNFYLRTKGQLEKALVALAFDRLVVVRPSLLAGARHEFRLGERIGLVLGKLLSGLLRGSLARYRPIPVQAVAWNLLEAIKEDNGQTITLESEILAAKFAAAQS
ncbi:NAD(P)H-binding protein [Chitinivorax sp. B]|uniref:NAD(P)H-binding protein n=1 Tax=Chitinivorax sp. B TaxID=2502235 RepID=UPI0010F69248|nr:NAD(P)H-binding protein [Chitinivorax sp. B]